MNQEGRGCVFLSIPSASHSGKHMETIYRMDQVLGAWRPGNWVKYRLYGFGEGQQWLS